MLLVSLAPILHLALAAAAVSGASGASGPSEPGATASAPPSPGAAPAPAPAVTAPVPPSTEPPPAVPPAPIPAPAPLPAPAPVAVAAPRARAPQRAATSPGEAVVHVAVSHRDAWLEMRSYVDGGEFMRICRAPCDLRLMVEGREARVTAPKMTTSNIFRFDAGDGTAGVRVEGGSASARRAGIITLAIGIPLALAGMGLFAQGKVKDNTGLTVAGIGGLAAGGVSIGISLPLLLIGTTHVKNAKGSLIATSEPRAATF
ncbi:MAG TPA: hypothetical protein VHP33_06925 [Polyangiaceae bacterium]|nr:hypothetical protein [Polyangiaceae bacterium]